MAAGIGSLVASLELQSAAFDRGLDRATQAMRTQTAQMQRQTRALEQSFRGVQRSVANLRTGIMALAGALAVRQFVSFTRSAIQAGDAIAKQADRLGVTTAALQEYRTLAELSGVGTQQLDRAMGDFTRRLGDLRNGQGQLATALGRSNIGLRDQLLAARSTSAAFEIFITSLGETEDTFQRNALAAAAFGRNAGIAMTTLATTIANTRPEVREFIREFLEMPEHLTRQAEQMNDTMALMQRAFTTGFHVGILEAFADAMNVTLDDMKDIRAVAEDLGRTVGNAMAVIARAARWAAENLRLIVAALSLFVAFRAATLFLDLAVALGRAAGAMVGLNVAMAANPMMLVAAGIAAAVAALILFHDRTIPIGPVSITLGGIVNRVWQNIADGIAGTIQLLGAFGDAWQAAMTFDIEALSDAGARALAGLEQVARSRLDVFRDMFEDAEDPASDLTGQVKLLASEVMGALRAADAFGDGMEDAARRARNPLVELLRETRDLQAQLAQFQGGGFGALEAEQNVQAATAMVRQWADANDMATDSFADLDAAATAMLRDLAINAAAPPAVSVETETAEAQIADLGVAIDAFAVDVAQGRPIVIETNIAPSLASLDVLGTAIREFLADIGSSRPALSLDVSDAWTAFDEATEALVLLQGRAAEQLEITADASAALDTVERLQEELFTLVAPTVEIDADLADAQDAITALRADIAALTSVPATVDVTARIEQALRSLSLIDSALDRIGGGAGIEVVAETAQAQADVIDLGQAIELLPKRIEIEADVHLGAGIDEVARVIAARDAAREQLATAQQRAQALAAAREEIGDQIEQQRRLVALAGRETEEYRVQARMLELKRRLGSGAAAGLEDQVRAAERLASQLAQVRELSDIRLETDIAGLGEIDQQFARILDSLNMLRGIEGGVPIIDTENAAFAVELMDALLIRQRELERAGLSRGIESGLRDVQVEVGLAGLPQAEREFAAFLRSLGILDVHEGELRTELQIDVRFAGQLGELEAAFDRLRAAELAAEIEADLAGAMGRFGDELERLARSAEALPDAFAPEVMQRGLERIGIAAIETGAAFEDVALALAMMGEEGFEAIAAVEARMKELNDQQREVISDMEQAWRSLGARIEDTAISATSRWLTEFRGARETFSNMLRSMANDLVQFGLRAALLGGVGGTGSRGGGGLFGMLFGGMFAEGGMIPAMAGVPQGRDGVPILAAPGEYIVNAASAQRYGPLLEAINADQLPRFQAGGMVGRTMAALPSAGGGGGDTNLHVSVSVDARGAGPDAAALLEEAVERGAEAGAGRILDMVRRSGVIADEFR